jgi:quinol monooxygenase YgiN
MILVDAECFIAPERRGDFIREIRKIVPVVLREKGCTRYELMLGITGESYHFLEEWASRQHLDEHLAQPHMREYFEKTHPWHASPTRLKIYEVASTESITMAE